jgi:hypothetical protein
MRLMLRVSDNGAMLRITSLDSQALAGQALVYPRCSRLVRARSSLVHRRAPRHTPIGQ